jgi:phosphomevalonate kinase
MMAMAPGKLVLTGAYAVLEGAPAIVAAIDRYAIADTSRRAAEPTAEVRAAFGALPAPEVDVRMLYGEAGTKLGLGSSAAALVASLAACALDRGDDLSDAAVRDTLFRTARQAHAHAQGGGSGVDVAASVYGGVQRYAIHATGASIEPVAWPREIVLETYFSGASVRTSDLLALVRHARLRRPGEFAALDRSMVASAHTAADALRTSGPLFVEAARAFGSRLSELGDLADAPIVPRSCAEIATLAAEEGAAFLPSGAGGGDVAVWIGVAPPSGRVAARALALGFVPLGIRIDRGGVRSRHPGQGSDQGN